MAKDGGGSRAGEKQKHYTFLEEGEAAGPGEWQWRMKVGEESRMPS